jgi:hypothetical protein
MEEDRRHVYFLLPGDLEQLELLKSSYIVGTRGTGKTTLLKSLSWKERLQSPSLQRALGGDRGFDQYLGVYLKLPEFQLQKLEEWLEPSPGQLHATITALYIDLIWIEALVDAVEEMRSRQLMRFSIEEEAAFVQWFAGWWEERGGRALLQEGDSSLLALKKGVFTARHGLEVAAVAEVDPTALVTELPIDQIGALGRVAADQLRTLCEPHESEKPQWHIRICMDEAEMLSHRQQLVLNTMVRLSGFPLFFLAAFAAMPRDVSSTLLPNQTLSEADRHLDLRDKMQDDKFTRLTEGVCESRVRAMLGDEEAVFDLDRLLGPLELDRWAVERFAKSEAAGAVALLQQAEELGERRGVNTPPILEQYLAEVEEREVKDHPTRGERSTGIRKKAPAVYVALLKKYGFDIRYASAPVVIQMSDGCIRDFLMQMDELYALCDKPLEEFLKSQRIPVEDQDTAFKRASAKKRQSLVLKIEESSPEEVERVVDGLARITAQLQAHIDPPEPGRFVLELGRDAQVEDDDLEEELKILREANHIGYLRVIEETGERLEFRVHTSLAPEYGFSYRGAYYKVPLLESDIKNLRISSDEAVASRVVKEIVRRFSPPASGTLFETSESDD